MTTGFKVVGKPIGRVEGWDKVTGAGRYPADVNLPGMLWAKLLRSPIPHGRLLGIDTSRARELPGVHAVLTAADLPDVLIGRMLRDIPLLARDRVRFIGDKVAVVAAESPDVAEEALELIDVEYEELPAVFDPVEASRSDAPVIHEKFDDYGRGAVNLWSPDFPRTDDSSSNLFSRVTWSKGNIEEGFAQSDLVFEHTFTMPLVHQAYLEPHACVVLVEADGHVQVWAHNKQPHTLRRYIASAVGLQPEQVTVNVAYIGGDFGGKSSAMDVPLTYFVARATGRPVKMVMTYTEELMASNPRHSATATIRTGVKSDGTIMARKARLTFNGGAYAAYKTLGYVAGANQLGGCYNIPNALIETDCAYTNTVPRGHARAPGSPQSSFAVESHTEIIARELGMDPLEFRLKNVLHEGDPNPTGKVWKEVQAEEVLRRAAEAIGWGTPKPGPNVGRGLSLFDHTTGVGNSNAKVVMEADGTATVYSPTFDHGTGIHTVQRQIVAEELTLAPEQVRVVTVDTDAHPPDGGVGNSRTTHTAGQAAYLAAQEVRASIISLAAGLLECPQEQVRIQDGRAVVAGADHRSVTLAEIVQRRGHDEPVSGFATYESNAQDYTSFCAQGAEVEVDPETGQVHIRKFVSVVDTGTVINPLSHRGQVHGGFVTGLGYALTEEMPVEEGKVTTLHLGDYKLPTMQDIPDEHTVIYIEAPSGHTPYRGKAVGETTNSPVTAAVANAVADAVGVRVTDLPITAEKVLRGLRAGKGD